MTDIIHYEHHTLEVECDCGYRDEGIGCYEWWGARQTHTDMQFFVEDLEVYLVKGNKRRWIEPSDDLINFIYDHLQSLENGV